MKQLFQAVSVEETEQVAKTLAKTVSKGALLAFCGDLGAGKTTFIRAFASQLGIEASCVNSPTFQYLNIYRGCLTLYHFDLYRLEGVEPFLELGFDEFLKSDGITCMEWAERVEAILPEHTIRVQIDHVDESTRTIRIESR